MALQWVSDGTDAGGGSWVDDSPPEVREGYSYFNGSVRQASGSAAFELLTDDGWKDIGTPAQAESQYYVTTALDSPVVAEFLQFAAEHPDQLNREQQIFMQDPLASLDSYGQGSRWGTNDLYDNVLTPQFAGQVIQTGDATQLTVGEQTAGAEFNYTESAEQQAARDTDDGFLGIALTVAALVFAPYIVPEIATALGVSNTAAAAIFGGAKSIVTGGDIGDILTSAVLGGAGAEIGGGVSGGEAGAFDMGGSSGVFDSAGNPLYAGGDWYTTMTGGEAQIYPWEAENTGGTQFASAGGMTDVPVVDTGGMSGEAQSIATASPEAADAFTGYGVGETASTGGTQAVTPGGAMDATGSLGSPMNTANTDTVFNTSAETGASLPQQGKGIISEFMGWTEGLDKGQAALLTAGVGAVGATVAGVGTALLNKSAQEEKIQAEKDLLSQKFLQDTEGKRQFVQGNPSVYNWRRPFRPSGQPLRRFSTGQPVYRGGLIASRMRGG